MLDIIKLLPDAVANQIAAGEVVQRPASAVKELLENSLDSGATAITVTIKDGGTAVIQVIDNGKGMTETDARMCWERHATSKINSAQDIYTLRTFGFRGEALASIAAVAQVELKTKRAEDEAASYIRIEGSKVLEQSLIPGITGTTITVKNLFYNIPARRNFLKSISVESRHILEEFQRQSLAYPGVHFKFINNGSETCNFMPTTLANRIKEVLGIKKEFIEVSEETEIIGIHGFIGAPDTARKTRGDQYLFVNDRYIRNPYFAHAIQAAFEGLTESNSYPLFVLFLTIDPAKVDVNVHPTKTEVKFEDERHIYNIIKAAVRKALGSYVIQPEAELFGLGGIDDFLKGDATLYKNLPHGTKSYEGSEEIKKMYNPFTAGQRLPDNRYQDWTKILGSTENTSEVTFPSNPTLGKVVNPSDTAIEIQEIFQLTNAFIVAKIQEELYVIDPKSAQERVLFVRFRTGLQNKRASCQQLIFPRTLELSPARLHTLLHLMEDFKGLGFDISHFGGNSIIINGLPPELQNTDETKVLEKMLLDYEETQGDLKIAKHDNLALSLARQCTISEGKYMDKESMQILVKQLFAVQSEKFYFDKKPVMVKIGIDLLYNIFRKHRNN